MSPARPLWSQGTAATPRHLLTLQLFVSVKVHEFKVKRAVLVDSSDYFRKLLEGPFIEAQQTAVPLLEDSAEGLHVWFSILHNANLEVTHEHITIRGVWETLAAAHKYVYNSIRPIRPP